MHILFVCTGNICRSPTAERLALAAGSADGLRASSAGTRALVGHPVHPKAAQVLADLGGDADGFTARRLTPAIAGDADLILAMARSHRDAILEIAPRQLRRTFTLAEASQLISRFAPATVADLAALRPQLLADQAPDVPDPIGQDMEVFAQVGAQIADLLGPIVEFCRRASTPA